MHLSTKKVEKTILLMLGSNLNLKFQVEDKDIQVFFNKHPSCWGSKVKNGLKVKQLAKQPPTLKTLIQNFLAEHWVNNLTFSILSSLKLNFFTTVFGTT